MIKRLTDREIENYVADELVDMATAAGCSMWLRTNEPFDPRHTQAEHMLRIDRRRSGIRDALVEDLKAART